MKFESADKYIKQRKSLVKEYRKKLADRVQINKEIRQIETDMKNLDKMLFLDD